jgi:hypothetical protein
MNAQSAFLIVLGLLVYVLVGCAFLATVDDENESLLAWANKCQICWLLVGLWIWPGIAFMFWKYKRGIEK